MKIGFVAIVLAALPLVVSAQPMLPSAAISATTTPDGSIQLTLSWLVDNACSPFSPVGSPTVAISGQNIQMSSVNGFFDCPGPVPISPYTATIKVNIGPLPNGIYTVVWSFTSSLPYAQITPVTAKFVVSANGVTPISVPALSPIAEFFLVLALAVIALRSIN